MFDDLNKYMPTPGAGVFPPNRPATPPPPSDALGAEMRETINRLLNFESRIKTDCESLMSTLSSDNKLFKDTFAESYRLFLEEVKNEINAFQRNVDNSIAVLTGDHSAEVEAYKQGIDERIAALMSSIDAKVDELNKSNADVFANYKNSIDSRVQEFETTVNKTVTDHSKAINDSIQTLSASWDGEITARLASQDARIVDAETYMRMTLDGAVREAVTDMVDNGTITVVNMGGGGGKMKITLSGEDMTDLTTDVNFADVLAHMTNGGDAYFDFLGTMIPVVNVSESAIVGTLLGIDGGALVFFEVVWASINNIVQCTITAYQLTPIS